MADQALNTAAAALTHACRDCGDVKPHGEFYIRARGTCWRCKACSIERTRVRHHAKRDELLPQMRARYQQNRDSHAAYMAAYRRDNAETLSAKKREYAAATKPEQALRMAAWKRANKDRVDAHHALRRATQLRAAVAWSDFDMVRAVYKLADEKRAAGLSVAVDHAVPLTPPLAQSLSGNFFPKKKFVGPLIPLVQGLHTHTNLEIIGFSENIAKLNRRWPDMPNYERL